MLKSPISSIRPVPDGLVYRRLLHVGNRKRHYGQPDHTARRIVGQRARIEPGIHEPAGVRKGILPLFDVSESAGFTNIVLMSSAMAVNAPPMPATRAPWSTLCTEKTAWPSRFCVSQYAVSGSSSAYPAHATIPIHKIRFIGLFLIRFG